MKCRAATANLYVVGFLIVVLVAASSAVALYLSSPERIRSVTTTPPFPATVNVFGLASTVGQGTHMVALTFSNTKTGANFTAPVSDGKYSVTLPNVSTYEVVARWAGNYSWQAGIGQRGELTVNMTAGSMAAMSYNLQAETPPTVVAVHGTILWSLPSAQPVRVVYTSSDGESIDAAVQNSTFSTRLPNMMDYQVKVFWQYADGTTDYLFGANQTVNEGIGVVGLDLSINSR